MSSMEAKWEWLDAPGAAVRSHGLTWSRFELAADGRFATEVADERARSTRRGVFLPLMPLAEWLAANWWFLFEELAPAIPLRSRSTPGLRRWFGRHGLLSAREGYPLPDLTIHRADDALVTLTMVADERSQGHSPVRFINGFECTLPGSVVARELGGLVSAVLERLEGCADADAAELRALWAERRSGGDEDQRLRRSAAALGLDGDDPSEVDEELAAFLTRDLSRAPPSLASELLEVAAPTPVLRSRWAAVESARQASSAPDEPGILHDARFLSASRPSPLPPYVQGWEMARMFRSNVLQARDDRATGEVIERALARFLVQAPLREVDDRGLVGWVDAAAEGRARCAVRSDGPPTRLRFVRARALAMALLGGRERLITESTARPQRVARAFAAELLAPVEAIRQVLPGPVLDPEQVEAIAARLGVAPRLVVHQVENHGLAAVAGE